MKKILFVLIITIITLSTANNYSQVLVEDFNYITPAFIGGNGAAGTNSNNWTTHSVTTGQTTTIDVIDGSLTHPSVISTGNKIFLPGSNSTVSRDINRVISSSATTLYFSAIVNIVDNTQLSTTGDYFIHFGASSGATNTIFGARTGAKSVNAGANYRFVILNTSGGTTVFTEFPVDMNFGTTYLIVAKYDRSTSPTTATLWVDPNLSDIESNSTSVVNTSGTGTFNQFASICLRNSATTPKVYIDEIRVTELWSEIALPVELISFNSSVNENKVTLSWETAWEYNNKGFEVERDGAKIGFVNGKNTASSYSFYDNHPLASGIYSYKLKQIDYNGNYEYFPLSHNVVVGTPKNFNLDQNYPNPCNPTTNVNFSVPEKQFIRLQLYDILGREVRQWINEWMDPGYYTKTFNLEGLSSGMYFYALSNGSSKRIVKKLTIVK